MTDQDDDAMLSVGEVGVFIGGAKNPLSRAAIYAWVKKGKLPPPIKLDYRMSRWRLSEVRAARDAIFAAQDAKP